MAYNSGDKRQGDCWMYFSRGKKMQLIGRESSLFIYTFVYNRFFDV
jgi:hypothetical protein